MFFLQICIDIASEKMLSAYMASFAKPCDTIRYDTVDLRALKS